MGLVAALLEYGQQPADLAKITARRVLSVSLLVLGPGASRNKRNRYGTLARAED